MSMIGKQVNGRELITMAIDFFLPMVPPTCTHQEKKVAVINGKPVFYDPPEVNQARLKLCGYLAKFKPEERYECGVQLVTKWCFPRKRHRQGEYRITKPDTDNIQKLCMTTVGFWKDDALVASEVVEKFWADPPGIYIMIRELTEL